MEIHVTLVLERVWFEHLFVEERHQVSCNRTVLFRHVSMTTEHKLRSCENQKKTESESAYSVFKDRDDQRRAIFNTDRGYFFQW
jgi:hypothetical protein